MADTQAAALPSASTSTTHLSPATRKRAPAAATVPPMSQEEEDDDDDDGDDLIDDFGGNLAVPRIGGHKLRLPDDDDSDAERGGAADEDLQCGHTDQTITFVHADDRPQNNAGEEEEGGNVNGDSREIEYLGGTLLHVTFVGSKLDCVTKLASLLYPRENLTYRRSQSRSR